MRYTVTTFKVRLEVCESGIRMSNSALATKWCALRDPSLHELDADKEHFRAAGAQQQEPGSMVTK